MPKLMVVIASTRPRRVGLAVGQWFVSRAKDHGGFDLDVADLAEVDLPFLDEPKHPRFHDYAHDHTREWGARVEAADAFVFVTAEYNHGYPAPLKNAIDYLNREWAYKPVGLVSYGGVSGGLRAVQALKPVISALRMTPVLDAVTIPMVRTMMHDGTFEPNDIVSVSVKAMLDELVKLAGALGTLRSAA